MSGRTLAVGDRPSSRALGPIAGLLAFLIGCTSAPEAPEPPRDSGPSALSIDLDRQKGATRSRMEGGPEAVAPRAEPPAAAAKPPEARKAPEPPSGVEKPVAPQAKVAPPRPEPAPAAPPAPVGPPPDWCRTRRHPGYPDSEYLVGLGSANAQPGVGAEAGADAAYREAWGRAVADILAQFETRITSEVTGFIQSSLKIQNQEEEVRLLQAGSSRVRATVEGSLEGVQPADRYFNPQTGACHVLIALKRTDYARQVAEELKTLNDKIGRTVAFAKETEQKGEPFRAYRLYRDVEALLVGSHDLRTRVLLAVPDYELPATPAALEPAEIHASRLRLASSLEILLVVEQVAFGASVSSASAEEKLMSRLKSFGFKVKPAPPKLAGKPVEELTGNTALVREALGGGQRSPLLLGCKLTTQGRRIESDLFSVKTEGWARLLDVAADEILLTATAAAGKGPDGKPVGPAIGLETQKDELATKSASGAALVLAEQIYAQL